MTKFIKILRACLFLIEAFIYNPPPTIRKNQEDQDDNDQILFL